MQPVIGAQAGLFLKLLPGAVQRGNLERDTATDRLPGEAIKHIAELADDGGAAFGVDRQDADAAELGADADIGMLTAGCSRPERWRTVSRLAL